MFSHPFLPRSIRRHRKQCGFPRSRGTTARRQAVLPAWHDFEQAPRILLAARGMLVPGRLPDGSVTTKRRGFLIKHLSAPSWSSAKVSTNSREVQDHHTPFRGHVLHVSGVSGSRRGMGIRLLPERGQLSGTGVSFPAGSLVRCKAVHERLVAPIGRMLLSRKVVGGGCQLASSRRDQAGPAVSAADAAWSAFVASHRAPHPGSRALPRWRA
jgi:hypothetical protein